VLEPGSLTRPCLRALAQHCHLAHVAAPPSGVRGERVLHVSYHPPAGQNLLTQRSARCHWHARWPQMRHLLLSCWQQPLPAAVAEPQQRQQLLRLLSPLPHAGESPCLTAGLSRTAPLHPSLLAETQGERPCCAASQPLSAESPPYVPAVGSARLYYYYYCLRARLLHCLGEVPACQFQRA
jgi:hypothetical protein